MLNGVHTMRFKSFACHSTRNRERKRPFQNSNCKSRYIHYICRAWKSLVYFPLYENFLPSPQLELWLKQHLIGEIYFSSPNRVLTERMPQHTICIRAALFLHLQAKCVTETNYFLDQKIICLVRLCDRVNW